MREPWDIDLVDLSQSQTQLRTVMEDVPGIVNVQFSAGARTPVKA